MSKKLKIGIIQNTPLTADFPNNLRQIVQGYRECLDHDAEIIVAPAHALCGADPMDMADRNSFIGQTEAALHALSLELGEVPLILGAYTRYGIDPMDDELLAELMQDSNAEPIAYTQLSPYLLTNNEVTLLENGEVCELDDKRILVYCDDSLEHMDDENIDVKINLACAPWYAGAQAEWEHACMWDAKAIMQPVVSVKHVGCTGENIYAGGSAVFSAEGDTIARLPLFESAARVVNVYSKARAKARPTEEEQMCSAIEFGIRETVRNNGFTGVCLSLDTPNASLLAALCVEALGRSNVVGITTSESSDIATSLRITTHKLELGALMAEADKLFANDSTAIRERILAAAQYTYAESRGLMYVCPLARRDFMLGTYNQYGSSCGHFAPLGNLYEMDLHMLRVYLSEKYATLFGALSEPGTPATDRIIHELADRNLSATELMNKHTCPFEENEIRLVQRKIIASAIKRTQMPPVLRADKLIERIELPVSHRMND